MTNKINQRARVLNWLQTHDGLTVREAVTELNIMSLPEADHGAPESWQQDNDDIQDNTKWNEIRRLYAG